MPTQDLNSMKLFRFPGLQIWNTEESGSDTRFLYREIFERRCYEKNGVAVADGDIVFDVGANVGMFAVSLMQRFHDLQIYCFEPVPCTYACLSRNLDEFASKNNNRPLGLNVGLGGEDATTTMEFFPGAPSNSTLHSTEKRRDFGKVLDGVRISDLWRTNKLRAILLFPLFPFRKKVLGPAYERVMAGGQSISCEIRTVSGIIEQHRVPKIDLLKVDVEGAEMDVLSGIAEHHWPIIRQLVMEVEPANKHLVPGLTERLRSLGFGQVVIESMFGGPSKLDDSVACTVFAVRAK